MRRLALFALVLAACASEDTIPFEEADGGPARDAGVRDAGTRTDAGVEDPVDAGVVVPPSPKALVRIVPLDLWGRDLAARVTLNRDVPERPAGDAPGARLFELPPAPYAFDLAIEADDHAPAHLRFRFDGRDGASAYTWTDPGNRTRVASALSELALDGRTVPVVTLFVGLDHRWFAASGRAPTRNRVGFLMDGEETFAAVHAAVSQATRHVEWSTWWWESDFELVRGANHVSSTEAERRANTVMALAESKPDVRWRVLLNRFWGENSDFSAYLNTDTRLLFHAQDTSGNVELILQGNGVAVPVEGQYAGRAPGFRWGERVKSNRRWSDVTLQGDDVPGDPPWPMTLEAASWHQKAVVVDGRTAFVIGMNTKGDDWDDGAHRVFDPRRMRLSASAADRSAVTRLAREPDFEPRKDYGVKLDGPIVRDVAEVLHGRWTDARAGNALYANRTTAYALDAPPAVPMDGVPTQLVLTMPGPAAEMSLLETHAKAFLAAEELVIIEDQYFRSQLMNDRLVARMIERPGLHLVVVTMDLPATDPGKKYTYLSDVRFRRLFPDRYQLLTLKAVDLAMDDGVFTDELELVERPIFIHSKVRIVDDRYLSVGSCNMNNRGYLFEGELNVSVLDRAWVGAARRRVLENLVGPADAPRLNGNAANDFRVLREVAGRNAAIAAWWRSNADSYPSVAAAATERAARWPSGFVYPLEIAGDYWFDPGPDLY